MSINQDIRYKQPDANDPNNPEGFYQAILNLKPAFNMLSGSGPPAPSLGLEGATYIDTLNNTEYLKKDGAWSSFFTFSSGTITTGANLGGVGVFDSVLGSSLLFKGLTAGSNITLTPSATDITINASSSIPSDIVCNSIQLSNGSGLSPCIKIGSQVGTANGFFRSGLDTYIISAGQQVGYFDPGGTVMDKPVFGNVVGGATPQYTWNAAFTTGMGLDVGNDLYFSRGGSTKLTISPVETRSTQNINMQTNGIINLGSLNLSSLITDYRLLNVSNTGVLSYRSPPVVHSAVANNMGNGTTTIWWGTTTTLAPVPGLAVPIVGSKIISSFSFKVLYDVLWVLTSALGTMKAEVGYIPAGSFTNNSTVVTLASYDVPLTNNPQVIQNNLSLVVPDDASLVCRVVNVGALSTSGTADGVFSVVLV